MYDISWSDIKEKLKFRLKCMLNKLTAVVNSEVLLLLVVIYNWPISY